MQKVLRILKKIFNTILKVWVFFLGFYKYAYSGYWKLKDYKEESK